MLLDHPWAFNMSILLNGSYIEHTADNEEEWVAGRSRVVKSYVRNSFRPIFRFGRAIHRIELFNDASNKPKHIWTIFVTGPVVGSWYFFCKNFIRSHTDFLKVSAENNTSVTGLGCD